MGKKKKPFIDKKNAHKFELVHRSQRDPLQADDETSQRVLLPVESANNATDPERAEQKKYGIFFDDDYDYMQHMRPRGEGVLITAEDKVEESDNDQHETFQTFGNVILPSTLFSSKFEEEEGLLSKGVLPIGPQPDWDPDVVAALDDGIDLTDPDNLLEDDFMLLANAPSKLQIEDEDHYPNVHGLEYDSDNQFDDLDYPSDEAEFEDFDKEEVRSRFTNYSMTSSVIRRTQELQVLDERFDKILESYDDDQIGGLDDEDISGILTTDNPLLDAALEEINLSNKTKIANMERHQTDEHRGIFNNESDNGNNLDLENFSDKPKEKWDCDSIISTYSNLYNHPKIIKEPQKSKQSKITKDLKMQQNVLEQKLDTGCVNIGLETCIESMNIRPRNETAEEKTKRKQIVKDERRTRRVEKKTNKIAFKTEHKIQEKLFANLQTQPGVRM